MVDLAASQFPASHRGTGTSVIMGAGDVGMLLGFFAIGELIDGFGYEVAFAALAVVVVVAGVVLGISTRPKTAESARE
jgi:MFS family permease